MRKRLHRGTSVSTTTSTGNVDLVKRLGADTVIDHRTQDFADVLRDQDLVLNSQDGKTLHRSFRVLRPGGKLISISGPPDPAFGRQIAAPLPLRAVMWLLSAGARRQARSRRVDYRFLFMRADGSQLREITRLVDAGVIRPVIDTVYPFAATNDALAHVVGGRARGKVVIAMR